MGDLIDRQAAIDAIDCDITITGRQNAELVAATIGTFADRIKALPAADVVPVVRRWDCRYRVAFDKCCHPDGLLCAKANNFCNYGKRRE